MQIPHDAVVLGEVLLHFARRLQLVEHRLHQLAILRVGDALGDHVDGDAGGGEQHLPGERDVGRLDARFLDAPPEDVGKREGCEAQQLRDDAAADGVEPGRRIADAARDVVVRDQALVALVRHARVRDDEFGEPVLARRQLDVAEAPFLFAEDAQVIIGLGDAPLGRPVDVVLCLRLARVEGHQGVAVIVAQHARAVDGRRPVLALQRVHEMLVPGACLVGRPAPQPVARVQHVVGEILELVVGRLRAVDIELRVLQEHALPLLPVLALEVLQGVQRKLVVRALRVGRIRDRKKQVHGCNPLRIRPLTGESQTAH